MRVSTSKALPANLRKIVSYYIENLETCRRLQRQVNGIFSSDPILSDSVHSIRSRVKEPSHLGDKLERMAKEAKRKRRSFSVTAANLFKKVHDCVGFRLLHIRAQDFPAVNGRLGDLLPSLGHKIVEGPVARVWDDESRQYYRALNIRTVKSETMYTSVHYVVESPRDAMRYEIQVRTLMEEVWGEVDHSFNYPHKTPSVACQEQILTLARFVSGCNRLVESIFKSRDESDDLRRNPGRTAVRATRKRAVSTRPTRRANKTKRPRS